MSAPTVAVVRIEVGPLPSASALAWLDYAQGVLAPENREPVAGGDLPEDVAVAFATYLAEWRVAAAQATFTWSTEVPEEVAEYLLLAFYRIARRLSNLAGVRGGPQAPPASHAFYVMLVDRLLEALAGEGPGPAEFAEHLRSFWPGLEP